MVIFEIIFFALLSMYLFIRLWSVLGDRGGFDASQKKGQNHMSDMDQMNHASKSSKAYDDALGPDDYDNVVPIRQRHNFKHTIVADDAPFKGVLDAIAKKDPKFTPESFVKKGVQAFHAITQAFVEGDHDTLKLLLTPTTYGHFQKALQVREEQGHRLAHDIVGDVRAVFDDAHLDRNMASITLKFTSHQRVTTYDGTGTVIDNPEDIAVKMVNYWTFERDLSQAKPVWRLSKTRVDDAI